MLKQNGLRKFHTNASYQPYCTGTLFFAMISLLFVLFTGSSAALTLMMPYTETDVAAPFPHAFAYRGLNWAKYVIAIGALFGIITSLLGKISPHIYSGA